MRISSTLGMLGLVALGLIAPACAPADDGELVQGAADSAILPGSPEEAAVLAVANDPAVDLVILDDDVGLDSRAATNIIEHRDGPDALALTSDDDLFDDIDELDAIKYVGNSALDKLLAYAKANGYFVTGGTTPTPEEMDWAMLALASDATVDLTTLDDAVGLDSRAANNIVEYRDSLDGLPGTADDRVFMRVEQLDDLGYVGNSALDKLRAYALDNGYLDQLPSGTRDVIFSPQPYYQSHNARVVDLIDSAQVSLDVAMYSFSENSIYDALEDAVQRGVAVRFIFETAKKDKNKTGASLANSRSARLENMGINVQYVNKIMHHKFVIVDGPQNTPDEAAGAKLATGSGNWSYGAATKYDENTLFLDNQPELALRFQAEFNLLWEHSRDFVWDATLPDIQTPLSIDPATIADTGDAHAVFTSPNFNPNGDTFSIITGKDTVADALVAAIETASDSIWVASGHLRSRPVSEALMAKRQARPDMDIRVYLDGQEYISNWYHNKQLQARVDCLASAGTSQSKIRKCYDKGFLYGYELGNNGIDVRYKYYSYRWHYTYAAQMHNKLMIIDGDELWTGSYNLSDNAEHNTFENMIQLRGLQYAELIESYRSNFLQLWETERDGSTYANLLNEIETAADIPLVFTPMALNWAEVTAVKQAIYANCSLINTNPFRQNPEQHHTCPRE